MSTNCLWAAARNSLASINRAADEAIGGWQLTGIATFQNGFPYEVTATDIQGITGSGGMRANLTSGCNLHDNTYAGNLAKFFRLNMNCFTGPAFGTYGNTGRNFLNQPGINNWDMGFGKAFALGERAKFVFKADAFNIFNHHQYCRRRGRPARGWIGRQPERDGQRRLRQRRPASTVRRLPASGNSVERSILTIHPLLSLQLRHATSAWRSFLYRR